MVKIYPYDKLDNYFNYYPEYIECIDNCKDELDLEYGFSSYWYAKQITMFSKNDNRVYSVHLNTVIPNFHVRNKNWYYKNEYGKYKDPKFNFYIVEPQHLEIIKQYLGNTLITVDCDGLILAKYPEFYYEKGNAIPKFVDPNVFNN